MSAAGAGTAGLTVDQLLRRITSEHEQLSPQLKTIARYFESHRDHVGLDGIQDVARQCGVQPSAVVRFAKHFGYTGFSDLQKVFRDSLSRQIAPGRTYRSRIRDIIESGAGTLPSGEIAQAFLSGAAAGLQELQRGLDAKAFARAVDLLAGTDAIWVAGARRAFPVAAYLAYALQHTDKRVQLVSALGGMHEGQVRSIRRRDVLVAVSFAPYAEETLAVTATALARGARLVALTDSRMSPLARQASAVLLVQEHVTFGFRTLTSPMALAQSLFIALACRLELQHEPAPHSTH